MMMTGVLVGVMVKVGTWVGVRVGGLVGGMTKVGVGIFGTYNFCPARISSLVKQLANINSATAHIEILRQ